MIARVSLAALAALLTLAFTAPLAHADTTLVVNTLANWGEGEECEAGSECSLREALEAAEEASGVVTIDVEVEGTIETEEAELKLEVPEEVSEVLIEGPGSALLSVDGEGESRVLRIEEPGKVVISGLTLAHGTVAGLPYAGAGGGGLLVEEASVELRDVRVTGSKVSDARWGGGIEIRDEGSLTLRNSEVDHNTASGFSGGGIYVNPGTELSLVDTTVADNVAGEDGGGISTYHATATVTDSVVRGNEAGDEGGGINASMDVYGHGTLVVEGSEITENEAEGPGGGINTSAETEVIDSRIVHNHGRTGGGLFAEGNELLLSHSTVSSNEAAGSGGGVSVVGYVPMVPIEHEPNQTTIEQSTIAGNHAGYGPEETPSGGGLTVDGESETTVEASTVADNDGGAILVAGELTLRNSTVSGNSSAYGTGGVYNDEGEATIRVESSILAANTHEGSPSDCSGPIESNGYNILGTEAGCGWTGTTGDQVGADPELAPLGDYGGPTATMPPQSRTSPAINHGEDPGATDQRGLTRPVPSGAANTDVGAVEVQAPSMETAPSISPGLGVIVGNELECLPGTWDTDTVTDPAITYSWRAGPETLGTGQTLTIEAAYVGDEIVCEATVDNGVEAVTAESEPLKIDMPIPVFEVTALDFGARPVGDGPAPRLPLKVKNEGNTGLNVLAVTDGGSAVFPFDASDCFAGLLAPGESCEIEVGFAPATRGAAGVELAVETNGGQIKAALSGEGTETALTLDPTAIEFGDQRTGTASAVETVQVENTGNTPLAIGVPTLEGADAAEFTLDAEGCESLTLEAGESCAISVAFSPAATGVQQAILRVPGEAEGNVALAGTGIEPALTATPTLLEFGSRALAAGPSAPQLVVVRNEGTAAADIATPTFSGPGAGQFRLGSLDTCPAAPLAPGAECSLEVVFAPTAAGSFNAELRVQAGDVGTAVALRGTATAPAPEPPPPAEPSARLDPSRGLLKASAGGVVRPRLTCTSPSGAPCATTVTLLRGGQRLGRWSGSLTAGASRPVALRLAPAARRALAKQHRLSVTATVQTGAGQPNRSRLALVR